MTTRTTGRQGGKARRSEQSAALSYQSGFGNEFATEALPGALPAGQNSPQRAPYGLYAEQLSGTAFTAPRGANRRSWLYRIRPAAMHEPFRQLENGRIVSRFDDERTPPNQLRWDPLPLPQSATDFVDGLVTMAGNGDPMAQTGCGIYVHRKHVDDRFFLRRRRRAAHVPQEGACVLQPNRTHRCRTGEIVVIPRGIRFRVELLDATGAAMSARITARRCAARPGAIGSNGLANPRFPDAAAWYGEHQGSFELIAKFMGNLDGESAIRRSTWWRGTVTTTPTNTISGASIPSVRSADHPTLRSSWCCNRRRYARRTIRFRHLSAALAGDGAHPPARFHRNVASEPWGIHGVYDAKSEGFLPGGASLHNCMSGHGPDARPSTRRRKPTSPRGPSRNHGVHVQARAVIRPTRFAESAQLQHEYFRC
jgi:homogentisate 1,2-dioxygenase